MEVLSDFITPIEQVNNIWVKRNDLYIIGKCNGGKAASAYELILDAKKRGYDTVVTTGSRFSPQCEIVSNLCEMENLKCHLFMPNGKATSVMERIQGNPNSSLEYSKVGYQSVLNSYAKRYAKENNYYLIPFGMQCSKNVKLIAKQCENIPKCIKRIIVPVGSGMTYCGILQGLVDFDRYDIELVGVITGGRPERIIKTFAPKFVKLPKHSLLTFEPELNPASRYNTRVDAKIGDIELDKIYEAKCFNFIQDGDLFWIVGHHDI